MGLLKSLLTLWVLEETRQTWSIFSKLKALVDSEKTITRNSEFSLPSMIPYVTVKFRVIIFGHRETITRYSEFTWQEISRFPTYHYGLIYLTQVNEIQVLHFTEKEPFIFFIF